MLKLQYLDLLWISLYNLFLQCGAVDKISTDTARTVAQLLVRVGNQHECGRQVGYKLKDISVQYSFIAASWSKIFYKWINIFGSYLLPIIKTLRPHIP